MAVHPAGIAGAVPGPHLKGENDELVVVAPLLELVPDWEEFLSLSTKKELKVLQLHEEPVVHWEVRDL